ncbi:trihelix transcription factor ENAP2-like isoform X1 [Cicer arietinum]|uniref:Trihelix transcription factor ASIL1-like isoform X1 n=1 Tax=Cicer arietinum TaxID=3827 RepID=A0A1S2YJK5_CICAR|nr:trihelix transcription factor ASIL1-like isoform X1 [Cicer arietinum]
MDSIHGAPSHLTSAPPRPPSVSPFTGREDCWSEDATFTLIDAWGEHYLDLNRGNLRQKHWQEVADAVNDIHAAGNNRKARRTDVQCKNRIDTLKKKYKIEKARVSETDGGYQSPWSFFSRLDALIGDTFPIKKLSPPANVRTTPAAVKPPPLPPPPAWIISHPVGPRSGTQKRPALANRDDASFRRNFSAFAAAAAAAAEAESEESEEWRSSSGTGSGKKGKESDKNLEFGFRELAQAIERFGDIYERVEDAKQRQMVELEKQRMQFAKDLEFQRMQLFMETQVQLQKIKRSKRSSGSADSLS